MYLLLLSCLGVSRGAVVLLYLDNCYMIQYLQNICRALLSVSVATLLMKLLTFTCTN